MPDAPALSFDETIEILAPALPDDTLVLVGGQALNYWLAYYRKRDARLRRKAGVTSTDIDILGSNAAINRIADALHVRPKNEGPRTSTVAVVRFKDRDGVDRIIDFMRAVHGLTERRVRETAVEVQTTSGPLRIMHPVVCLESRVHNVHSFEKYQDDRSLRQLDAAIGVARGYVTECCERNEVRRARRAIDLIAKLARSAAGRGVFTMHRLDPLDAIPKDARLGASFLREDLPRIRKRLGRTT